MRSTCIQCAGQNDDVIAIQERAPSLFAGRTAGPHPVQRRAKGKMTRQKYCLAKHNVQFTLH